MPEWFKDMLLWDWYVRVIVGVIGLLIIGVIAMRDRIHWKRK